MATRRAALAFCSCALAGAGCATSLAEPPPSFGEAPRVAAIYAGDAANAVSDRTANLPLSDVQLYSALVSDATARVGRFPPSYGSVIVEFDQPLDGSKVAHDQDLARLAYGGAAVPMSFCSQSAAPGIELIDVDAAGSSVPGSLCWDPSSALGRNPHLTFVVGRGDALGGTGVPFTCQAFLPENFSSDPANALALKRSHHYAVRFHPEALVNDSGKPLVPPTGLGWSGNDFDFTTDGFSILAAGYQDPGSGNFTWLTKPNKGFMKDLDEVGAAAFTMPADGTPFLIVTSTGSAFDSQSLIPQTRLGVATAVTARRADGSAFDARIWNDSGAGRLRFGPPPQDPAAPGTPLRPALAGGFVTADPRIVYVAPGGALPGFLSGATGGNGTWEPGQAYTIAISGDLASGDLTQDLGGTDVVYSFKAAAGSSRAVAITPSGNSVAQAVLNGQDSVPTGKPSRVILRFNAPIDAESVTTDNVTLTKAGASVAEAVTVGVVNEPNMATSVWGFPGALGQNGQAVFIRPLAPLLPETAYTVQAANLKVASAVPGLGGKAIATAKAIFQTATFRVASITRPCVEYPNNPECTNTRYPLSSALSGNPSVDLVANQPLDLLRTGRMRLTYINAALGVTPANVSIAELAADGTAAATLDPGQYALTGSHTGTLPDFARYQLQLTDDAYPIKCLQKYEVKSSTAITDATPAANRLKAEACATTDCPDKRTFTTAAFGLMPWNAAGDLIQYAPADAAKSTPDTIRIQFNASLDAASVNGQLADAIHLYGSSSTGNRTEVPINCPALPDDKQSLITCTANSPLAANVTYLASVAFTATAPALIARTTRLTQLPGYPTVNRPLPGDQATCRFAQTATLTFITPCAQ